MINRLFTELENYKMVFITQLLISRIEHNEPGFQRLILAGLAKIAAAYPHFVKNLKGFLIYI